MTRRFTLALSIFVLLTFGSATAAPKPKNKVICPQKFPTLGQCPTTGCGGDAKLNEQKNRTDDAQASPGLDEWTVQEILDLDEPSGWHMGDDRQQLAELGEGSAMVVKGYLVHADKTKTPEACNCYLTNESENDFHLNIVAKRPAALTAAALKAAKGNSVVVEITPRKRPPTWTLAKLKPLAKKAAYVRVTGWLLYDSMHTGSELQGRAASWEVHPITEFEVCMSSKAACDQGQNWKKLKDYNP